MELLHLRNEIDLYDTQIIDLLKKRFITIEKVANYKKQHSIDAVQHKRWLDLLEDRKKLAQEIWVDEIMIEEIWWIIHKYAIDKEKNIINN